MVEQGIHKPLVGGSSPPAATTVVMKAKGLPRMFRADRPFLFLIRHEKSGAILFMGRMADPTQENPPAIE